MNKIQKLEYIENQIEELLAFLTGNERFQNFYESRFRPIPWNEFCCITRWGLKDYVIKVMEEEEEEEKNARNKT